jgi:hypothetical protein
VGIFDVNFSGLGAKFVTFLSALTRGTDDNKVAKVSANKTVALCSDDDVFIGVIKAIDVSDKAATIQYGGYVTCPYTPIDDDPNPDIIPILGLCELDADATGGVKKHGTKYYQVIEVDATGGLVTFDLG